MTEPWIEKYRPEHIENIVLSNENELILKNIIDKDNYPNMIFYGPPGTGKTTTILCLIKKYQEKHNCKNNYIHLNASHQRGIDVIRNQIFTFINSNNFFVKSRKFVLLDEIDSMTKQAQHNLFHVIQKTNNKQITFILICNYLNKLVDKIRNNLMILHFNQTSNLCDTFIQNCISNENISISKNNLNIIKKTHLHDLRSIINNLQNYDKSDILLQEKHFASFLNNKNPGLVFHKLNKQHDTLTIFYDFFNFLYEKYPDVVIDDNICYIMKYMIVKNPSKDFFINEFLNLVKNKIDFNLKNK